MKKVVKAIEKDIIQTSDLKKYILSQRNPLIVQVFESEYGKSTSMLSVLYSGNNIAYGFVDVKNNLSINTMTPNYTNDVKVSLEQIVDRIISETSDETKFYVFDNLLELSHFIISQ